MHASISAPGTDNIYALGNWGTAEGLVFSNATARLIRPEEIAGLECVQGLDFGYTNDPTAFNQSYVDMDAKRIYVYDGFYEKGMSNAQILKLAGGNMMLARFRFDDGAILSMLTNYNKDRVLAQSHAAISLARRGVVFPPRVGGAHRREHRAAHRCRRIWHRNLRQ